MCKTCGCTEKKESKKVLPVRYQCACGGDCKCPIIEFEKEPKCTPYCCGLPMKRIK